MPFFLRCCWSICCSALAKSFPRLLLRLLTLGTFYSSRFLHTRAPDSGTVASSLCASLCFLLPLKANRKARRASLCFLLPDPVPPPRRALRCEPPVVCLGFGFDRFELILTLFELIVIVNLSELILFLFALILIIL